MGSAVSAPAGLRVSLLIPALEGGGAERVMLKLGESLDQLGYDVELLVGQGRGALAGAVPAGLVLVDFDRRHMRNALPALVRHLRRRRPHALLSTLPNANLVAILAGTLARTDTRVMVRAANMLSTSATARQSPKVAVVHALSRRLLARATMLLAVSGGVAEDLAGVLGLPVSAVRVIPNPIITPEVAELTGAPLTHPWFAPGQPPVVLGVGRLTRQKNFTGLIRAVAAVRRTRRVRLLILGEGGLRSELERVAAACDLGEDFALPGFDPNPYRFMARCGVFALSSHWEGLPGALIQAVASGAPVVATDCPTGPHEILEGGRYGALVPVDDVDALARAIESALSRRPAPAPPQAWARYTVAGAVEQYARAIEEAVTGSSRTDV